MKKYILSIDQGTSSSRAIVFDADAQKIACSQVEFPQYFPQSGWVEQEAEEIWESVCKVIDDVLDKVPAEEIAAIGITNQRETSIVWDADTGEAICRAIVWQDRRTAPYCDYLIKHGYQGMVKSKTGLLVDAYFSGTKIKWVLDNVPGARQRAREGKLRFGTVDSWLLYRLSGGKVHATDLSNASRTMLFNIHSLQWDQELLRLFDIPESMLPKLCSCSEIYGSTTLRGCQIPIAGMIGDQQSALFGQLCTESGMVKNTYGTGCFLLMNTGNKAVNSKHNLLCTVAYKLGSQVAYALEGSVFVAGAAVQWLRDGLGIIKASADIEALAQSVPDNGGVYFVPALTGLAAPYWDSQARGCIVGLSRGITAGHIARATLEGIAFQVADVVKAMQKDSAIELKELKVDGGASANNLLMQMQADILGSKVLRPKEKETTALGAAYMAGLAVGFWSSLDDIRSRWQLERSFESGIGPERRADLLASWDKAVKSILTKQ